jgi:hypothetical protein
MVTRYPQVARARLLGLNMATAWKPITRMHTEGGRTEALEITTQPHMSVGIGNKDVCFVGHLRTTCVATSQRSTNFAIPPEVLRPN